MWHDLVTMGIPFGEKVVRTVAVYVALALLLRVAGKRDLAAVGRRLAELERKLDLLLGKA